MIEKLEELEERLAEIEQRFIEQGYSVKKLVTSDTKTRSFLMPQTQTLNNLHMAFCVDTRDPLKQNRVRYFSPMFHRRGINVKQLPFAFPISAMGGFDDSGLCWVPPAGSMLALLFESGNRSSAFYIGTMWFRDRGADGEHKFAHSIPEYYSIHEGHRRGYLLGPDDGSQVLPQWNTENYNNIDITSKADFVPDPEAEKRTTFPNIYGFKTPQKHMLKMVDGDYKCNHKYKRVEMLSGCGNWLMFKDDHLHDFCADHTGYAPPHCEDEKTHILDGTENENCEISHKDIKISRFKHKNELRPFVGPKTPQNNHCMLPQSGIQILSISGHTMYMDDSVEEPREIPNWERSLRPFNFGCTNKYLGSMGFVSATGHRILMYDVESESELRSVDNGIVLLSAAGNRIQLCDHTKTENVAGARRGISAQTTSKHLLEMIDEDNEQVLPKRKEGGVPVNKAKNAYIRLRSGYGLDFLMQDANSQEETQKQRIVITAPQKDNTERGPHILQFQEAKTGPGQVWLKVGGDWVVQTYDNAWIVVGDRDKNPSDLQIYTSRNTQVYSEKSYFNFSEQAVFVAKKVIELLAGEDCEDKNTHKKGPCIGRVLVLTDAGVVASDRVFASASPDAPKISIAQLTPLHR